MLYLFTTLIIVLLNTFDTFAFLTTNFRYSILTTRSPQRQQTTIKMGKSLKELDWTSLRVLRESRSPSQLCPDNPTSSNPRLAKDVPYANAVLDSWRNDVKSSEKLNDMDTMVARLSYTRQSDGSTFSGFIVVNENLIDDLNNVENNAIPVIILYHTAAGPCDIFLMHKADIIAKDEIWGANGCIVFIADMISDETGWTWTDRDKYEEIKQDLFQRTKRNGEKNAKRWKLRETIESFLQTIQSFDEVNSDKIGAMGWCLGGHSILEMGRMNVDGVKALVTFHGVFDGINENEVISTKTKSCGKGALICNGLCDPFISKESFDFGIETLKANFWEVEVLQFENVKHGFTNPAQDLNPNDSFAFDREAATLSWKNAIELMKKYV